MPDRIATVPPKLLPVEAVMAQLSVGRNTVFNLITSKQLRSVKVGNRRLVPQAAVDELIANLLDAAESASDPRGAGA
jgi:excisionase family DNA binding protein